MDEQNQIEQQNKIEQPKPIKEKVKGIKKEINAKMALIFIGSLVVILVGVFIFLEKFVNDLASVNINLPFQIPVAFTSKDFVAFQTAEEFKQYLQENSQASYYGFGGISGVRDMAVPMAQGLEKMATAQNESNVSLSIGTSAPVDRVSQTNVQVAGIDEPDIVKTNGKEIFFSQEYGYYPFRGGGVITPMMGVSVEKMIAPYPYPQNQSTKVITAFPTKDLALKEKIDKAGQLLLQDNILIILQNDKIMGYDIAVSPAKEIWSIKLAENNYLVGSRLTDGKLYLISSQGASIGRPCPLKPFTVSGKEAPVVVQCNQIYHPIINFQADVVYTIASFDALTGKSQKTVSLVANSQNSVLYVSQNAIYLTYSYFTDQTNFVFNFLQEKAKDLAPQWVFDKLTKLAGYDISQQAKQAELYVTLEKWQQELSNDEQLKLNNELNNRLVDYQKAHLRDLEKTGIAKIGLSDLNILAFGEAPGRPLNQFSLDEYQNNLRIATTIGGNWVGGFGWGGSTESANDVYVLDNNLKTIGSVLNLGASERIYSCRFLQDKGYLVTFKQTDPFYVLDLSIPKKPAVKGELKIPGYSSYLHPLAKDIILGVGKENQQVKLSVFDVKDLSNPLEISKYSLNEYWSDVLNTHHAFLADEKYQVFFMPGGNQGGYVFSYKDNELTLQKAVSNIQAQRALYINDYLYVVGSDKIAVLNEKTWEKEKELDLED